MTVYVDDAAVPSGRMVLCHLWSDGERGELLAMADRIGVARRWLKVVPGMPVHFEVCRAKRGAAVAFGAVETDRFGPAETLARLDRASGDLARAVRGAKEMERIEAARRRLGLAKAGGPVRDLFGRVG